MLESLWGKRGRLLDEALSEAYKMLDKEGAMFSAACDALYSGKPPELDVTEVDRDINLGERLVRRLVFEHLTLNPQHDLPASLTLIGIVHDIERIGDYIKSILELSQVAPESSDEKQVASICVEIRDTVEPLIAMTLECFRDSDVELAREVMSRHRQLKQRTDDVLEVVMKDPDVQRTDVVFILASRFLRRISAHLSNIASSIANPFDRLGGDE